MNTFVWIDLGVKDLDRAVGFYQKVLNCSLSVEQYENFRFAVFDHQANDVAGCLVPQTNFTPLSESTLIYFNVDGRLIEATEQVAQHGGKVIHPPHSIGPHGARAIVLDSEGNTIALHASQPIHDA
ncbi:MAG: VOC family protein [Gammaproteobacteria bacterium]|nr:VOC family protein [Gammaproteobacteria bacterium]NVK88170.1 VOC family protein [Gammaproteobacteria bacterium]